MTLGATGMGRMGICISSSSSLSEALGQREKEKQKKSCMPHAARGGLGREDNRDAKGQAG